MSGEGHEDHMEMGHQVTTLTVDTDSDMMDHEDHRDYPPRVPPRIVPPRGTVIVSVTPGDCSSPDSHDGGDSNTYFPQSFSPTFTDIHGNQRLLKHLQVRQTLSEPSKARIARQKPHRMSPIPKRHDSALAKTLSVGGLDGASSGLIGWKLGGGDSSAPHSPNTMDSAHSSNESLNTTSSEGKGSHETHNTPTPPGAFAISKMPLVGGSPAWVLPSMTTTPGGATTTPLTVPPPTGVIPSQEQLEALHQKQLEMLALLEKQKNATAASTSGAATAKPEMFQFPIALWPVATSNMLTTPSSTSTSSPSPTPTSIATPSPQDSGGTPQPPHRPLGGSLSAPHGLQQQNMTDSQYEALLKQFQMQHQHILLQQQSLYQHYLDQQNKLMQQAMMEKKHFEEQQRQLTTMHLQQQQQLQRQQSLLRQMQEQQFHQLNRQQQMLILQTLGIQQQHHAASVNAKTKPSVGRHGNQSDKPDHYSPGIGGGGGSMEVEGGGVPNNGVHRSLSSTSSVDDSSLMNGRSSSPNILVNEGNIHHKGTGLIYDTMMLKHNCGCGSSHPEHPGRLQSIWARLLETGVVQKCVRLRVRKASLAELQTIHSENHVKLYGRPNKLKASQDKKDMSGIRAFVQLSCGGVGVDNDTYWNDQHTSNAARMAVGSLIELSDKIVAGEISNGLALIRPPGHHALPNQAMAFCYFNNVALTAKALIAKNKRVAIVDWDIHHGNGVQQIFYDSPAVLVVSIHRHDNGTFFPGTGRPEEIGSGGGMGFNVNIAFSGKQNFQGGPSAVSNCGDPEYLAAFRSVVVPIVREFNPDIIVVSAGFNATAGHPPTLGGYNVTPRCYAYLTRMLMKCGNGRLALALEGGYELMSLCESAEWCMKCLVGEQVPPLEYSSVNRPPQTSAVSCIEKTIACHKSYWPSLHQASHTVSMPHSEAEKCDDTIVAMASLSVTNNSNNNNNDNVVRGGISNTSSPTNGSS